MGNSFDLPWGVSVETDEAGRWLRVDWTMTGRGLLEALRAGGPQTRSAALDAGQRVLLLSDVVVLEGRLVAVSLLAARDPSPAKSLRLEAVVTAEQPQETPVSATLQWGNQTYTTALAGGRALFTGLPADSVGGGLRLTLRRMAG